MQMEYRGSVINLLDTPGHQDFSEDTYRVLTAVDAALMVIDAGNGVEPQTRRLLQVCRARHTPILTFVNKMDREVQAPLELMDEIERELGMEVVPFTWPVGMGKRFHGVMDLREKQMRVFKAGPGQRPRRRRNPRRPRQPRLCRSASAPNTSRPKARSNCSPTRPRRSIAMPSSPAGRRRCSSARPSTTSAFARCSMRWSTWRRRPARAWRSSAAWRPTRPSSPAWSSRSRPTWTRRTATASPSFASPRVTSSAACG